MSLENVHPVVLQRVQKQLPEGAVIISAMADSREKAVFMVEYKGGIRRAPMDKADIAGYFVNRKATLEVSEETPLTDVYNLLSETFKLYLVPGVDFELSDEKITFGGGSSLELNLAILFDSISLFGTLQFQVTNKDKRKFPNCCLPNKLIDQTIQLALTSKILETTGKVFTGNGLTNNFSKTVIDHLDSLGIEHKQTVESIGTSIVLDDLTDSFSRVVFINTVKGKLLVIRYKAAENDRPNFKKQQQPPKPPVEEEEGVEDK